MAAPSKVIRSMATPPLAGALALVLTAMHLLRASPFLALNLSLLFLGLLLAAWGALLLVQSSLSIHLRALLSRLADWWEIAPAQAPLIALGLGLAAASRAASGDGPSVHSPLATPLWLAGILLVYLGTRSPSQGASRVRISPGELGLLLLLTCIAFLIRAWRVESMPYVLSGDEGSAGLTAWEFLDGQRDNFLGLGWFSFPSLYFWLLSRAQVLLGRTVLAIRLPSAIAGALTIPATYWLVREMLGRRAAWMAALWLTAFHQHVFFSRVAYNNIFDGLFLALSAAALYRGWRQNRRIFFQLAGLAVGVSLFFYTTSRLIPILLALWCLSLRRIQADSHSRLPGLTSAALMAGATAMPLLMLYAHHPDSLLFTASRVSMLVPGWLGPAAEALGTTPLGLILEQTWITLLGLGVAALQGVYYDPGVPMLFGISLPLILLGLAMALIRPSAPARLLPLLSLAATLVVGGLSIQAPNAQRMLLLPPMLSVLLILPLEAGLRWVEVSRPSLSKATMFATGLLVLLAAGENARHLFLDYFPREEYGSLNGEVTQAMIEILAEEGPGTQIYFIGGERMAFDSIPSLPYLLPGVRGTDLEAPYRIPKASHSSASPRIFFILPEQSQAIQAIPRLYPGGQLRAGYNRHGRLLFYQYLWQP